MLDVYVPQMVRVKINKNSWGGIQLKFFIYKVSECHVDLSTWCLSTGRIQ
jgi:hypothetical protein